MRLNKNTVTGTLRFLRFPAYALSDYQRCGIILQVISIPSYLNIPIMMDHQCCNSCPYFPPAAGEILCWTVYLASLSTVKTSSFLFSDRKKSPSIRLQIIWRKISNWKWAVRNKKSTPSFSETSLEVTQLRFHSTQGRDLFPQHQ